MQLRSKKSRAAVRTPKRQGKDDASLASNMSRSSDFQPTAGSVDNIGNISANSTDSPRSDEKSRSTSVTSRRGLDLLTGMAGPVQTRKSDSIESPIPASRKNAVSIPGAMVPAKKKSKAFKEIELKYWEESNSRQRDFVLLQSLKQQMGKQLILDEAINAVQKRIDEAVAEHEWMKAEKYQTELSSLPKTVKEAEEIVEKERQDAERQRADEERKRQEMERQQEDAKRKKKMIEEAARAADAAAIKAREEEAQRRREEAKRKEEEAKRLIKRLAEEKTAKEAEELASKAKRRTERIARNRKAAENQARQYREKKLQQQLAAESTFISTPPKSLQVGKVYESEPTQEDKRGAIEQNEFNVDIDTHRQEISERELESVLSSEKSEEEREAIYQIDDAEGGISPMNVEDPMPSTKEDDIEDRDDKSAIPYSNETGEFFSRITVGNGTNQAQEEITDVAILSIEDVINENGDGNVSKAIQLLETKLNNFQIDLNEALKTEDFLMAHNIKTVDIPSIEATLSELRNYEAKLVEQQHLDELERCKREQRESKERDAMDAEEKIAYIEASRLRREAVERTLAEAEKAARETALKQLESTGELHSEEIDIAKRSPEQTVAVLEAKVSTLRENLRSAVDSEDFLEAANVKGSMSAVLEVLNSVRQVAKEHAAKHSREGVLRKAEELLQDQEHRKAVIIENAKAAAHIAVEERRSKFDDERERIEAELAAEKKRRAEFEAKAKILADEARAREEKAKAHTKLEEEFRLKAQAEESRVEQMRKEERRRQLAVVKVQSVHRKNSAKAAVGRIRTKNGQALTEKHYKAAVKLQSIQRGRAASVVSERLREEKAAQIKAAEEHEARRLAASRLRDAEAEAERARLEIEERARQELDRKAAEQEAERAKLLAMLEAEQRAREAAEATVLRATENPVDTASSLISHESHDQEEEEEEVQENGSNDEIRHHIDLGDCEIGLIHRNDYYVTFEKLPLPFQIIERGLKGSLPLAIRIDPTDTIATSNEILPSDGDSIVDIAGIALTAYPDPSMKAKQILSTIQLSNEEPLVIGFRPTSFLSMARKIQAAYRGYHWRWINTLGEEVMHIIEIRKLQKHRKTCAVKIQRRFQAGLVRCRFLSMKSSTVILQKIARVYVWRTIFDRKLRAGSLLVSYFRRWLKSNRLMNAVLQEALDAEQKLLHAQAQNVLQNGHLHQTSEDDEETPETEVERSKWNICNVDAIIDNQEIYPLGWGTALSDLTKMLHQAEHDQGDKAYTYLDTLDCGSTHTLALTSRGELYAWGWDDFGQLGHRDYERCAKPTLVTFSDSEKCDDINVEKNAQSESVVFNMMNKHVRVEKIACGNDHSLALTSIGKVYAWGRNNRGQLGIGMEAQVGSPELIVGLSQSVVSDIACGDQHSVAICEPGSVYSWGEGAVSGHGVFTGTGDFHEPREVAVLNKSICRQLACGPRHTLVLVESADAADYGSTLFTFGINDNGELGLGDTKRRLKPCVMIRPKGMEVMEHWVSLSGGGKHSVALTNQGRIWCWGWNRWGQIGVGDTVNRLHPSRLHISLQCFCQKRFLQVQAGYRHTAALTSDGELLAWGLLKELNTDCFHNDDIQHQEPSTFPQIIQIKSLCTNEMPYRLCCSFSRSISVTSVATKQRRDSHSSAVEYTGLRIEHKDESSHNKTKNHFHSAVKSPQNERSTMKKEGAYSTSKVQRSRTARGTRMSVFVQSRAQQIEELKSDEQEALERSRGLRSRGAIQEGAMLRYFRSANLVATVNPSISVKEVLAKNGRHDSMDNFEIDGVADYLERSRNRTQSFIISPVVRMFHDSLGQKSEQYKAYFNEMMKNSRRAHNIHTKVLGSREEAPTAGLRDLELRLEGLLGEIDRTVVADCFVRAAAETAVKETALLDT